MSDDDTPLPDSPSLVGEPTPRERARTILTEALLQRSTTKKRRGRRVVNWRISLAIPMARITENHPDEPNSALAQLLKDADAEAVRAGKTSLYLPNIRTLENWLSKVRQGQPLTGRKPLK